MSRLFMMWYVLENLLPNGKALGTVDIGGTEKR